MKIALRTSKQFHRKLFAILCTALMFASAHLSAEPLLQSERVSLSFKNAELKTVLKSIKQQTNYDLVYNAREVNDKTKVSVNVTNLDVRRALHIVLDELNIDFNIENKIIVLRKKATTNTTQQPKREVKGTVVDEGGMPLPGVNVLIKGSAKGTATDLDGHFTIVIDGQEKNPELTFTFMGMNTVTHKVTNNNPIRIVLKEASSSLQEVVITGMEVVKRERMTGSATVITAKDMRSQGVTSLDRILEGRITGLNSSTVSGAPGTRAKITIRGENNLSGNTEPLWIVDGLPMMSGVPQSSTGDYAGTIMQDGVGNILPEDIESVSILKDASAAAVYGARAANGVIVVTTKKGFRSKTQVSYSGTYNVGFAPKFRLDFMNTAEKLRYEQSIIDNFGLQVAHLAGRGGYLYKKNAEGYLTSQEYETELNRLRGVNTNWFDLLFRTAHSHLHSVSLRGGTDELNYYTSVSFQQQNGILRTNSYQNAGLLVKLDYRPIKNLIFAMNVSANSRKSRDHASAINPFNYAVFANPYERPYDENGNYAWDLSYLPNNYTTKVASGYNYERFNILKEMNETRSEQEGLDAQVTFNFRYEVIPGLSIESIARAGRSYNTGLRAVNAGTYTSWINETLAKAIYKNENIPSEYDNGELAETSGRNINWSIRNQIDYSLNLKDSHLFSILLANEVMSKKLNNFGYKSPIYYNDYRITGIPTFNVNALYDNLLPGLRDLFTTSDNQDRTVSFLGSMRYGFKDRYIMNFNFRADGADMIGDANRFAPLWSVGFRYNLHKEAFFKNNIINELSLRGSYGYTGNIDRSAYPFSMMGVGSTLYMGYRIINSFDFPNPTIKWEKKNDRNIGIDISLLNSRINLITDYYFNRVTDVLENLEVPASTGRTFVKANGGIVENSGLEFFVNVKWITGSKLNFSTSFNISANKNVIKKSHYALDSYVNAIRDNRTRGGILNIIGKETGGIYGWEFAGVNSNTGNPMYYLTDEGKREYAAFLDGWNDLPEHQKETFGDAITSFNSVPETTDFFRDSWAQPGNILMPSMKYLGSINPKYIGGFNTYIRYKNVEFTTDWTFKAGHLIPNFNDYKNAPGGRSDLGVSSTNRERKYLYYWKTKGDITDIPLFVTGGSDYWTTLSTSDKYAKGDYLRLTNMSFNYRFAVEIAKRFGLNNLALGLNIRNLFTFTKYRGLDVSSGGSFTYPTSREFNVKLTVGL